MKVNWNIRGYVILNAAGNLWSEQVYRTFLEAADDAVLCEKISWQSLVYDEGLSIHPVLAQLTRELS